MHWQKPSESHFYKTLESSQKRVTTRGRHGEETSCCFMVRKHCGILNPFHPRPVAATRMQREQYMKLLLLLLFLTVLVGSDLSGNP